jgi:hypothetical protein
LAEEDKGEGEGYSHREALAHMDRVIEQNKSSTVNWNFAYAVTPEGELVAAGSLKIRTFVTAELVDLGSIQKGAGLAVLRKLFRDMPSGVKNVVLETDIPEYYKSLGFEVTSQSEEGVTYMRRSAAPLKDAGHSRQRTSLNPGLRRKVLMLSKKMRTRTE